MAGSCNLIRKHKPHTLCAFGHLLQESTIVSHYLDSNTLAVADLTGEEIALMSGIICGLGDDIANLQPDELA